MGFNSQAGQIGHTITNGSPPLRRFFGAALPRRQAAGTGPAFRYRALVLQRVLNAYQFSIFFCQATQCSRLGRLVLHTVPLMLSVKQGSCKYQLQSHWFDPTRNQTQGYSSRDRRSIPLGHLSCCCRYTALKKTPIY